MPKKSTRKYSRKKPSFKPKGGRRYRSATKLGMRHPYVQSMAWHGSPFPREMMTQITYAENLSITATLGLPSNYEFRSNSLYDPNATGTGTQPRFFDTICGANNTNAPYQAYRVFGCKVDVEFIPTGSDSTAMRGFVGIGSYSFNMTGPGSLAEMRARSDFKVKPIGYWSGGHDITRIRRYINIRSLFGIKDMKDDEDTAASYGATPVKDGRICISYVPFDESSTRTVQALVKLIYYVQFFQRNDVSNS